AYINQDNGETSGTNTTLWMVQGGIAKNWLGVGNTVLYGEYARIEDSLLKANYVNQTFSGFGSSEVWGLGVVQHIDAAGMELFLSYRNYSGEANGVDARDMDVVMGGARIKF